MRWRGRTKVRKIKEVLIIETVPPQPSDCRYNVIDSAHGPSLSRASMRKQALRTSFIRNKAVEPLAGLLQTRLLCLRKRDCDHSMYPGLNVGALLSSSRRIARFIFYNDCGSSEPTMVF